MFDMIAFDADDTLWHTHHHYIKAHEEFIKICSEYCPPQLAAKTLDAREIDNITLYGYGIKSFALSMVETAIEITEAKILASSIHQILEISRSMLDAEIEIIKGVEETLASLFNKFPLMLITKGDSHEQGRKIHRSGLSGYFRYTEIISEKDCLTYKGLMDKFHINPKRFLMIGNSVRSDIIPVIELGGAAIYIPHRFIWSHETVNMDPDQKNFLEIENITLLPQTINTLIETRNQGKTR